MLYVSPELGERATAKRTGTVKEDAHPTLKKPITFGAVFAILRDSVFPLLASLRVRGQEDRLRVTDHEARLAEQDARITAIEKLQPDERLKALEARPDLPYAKVWVLDRLYRPGEFVTWDGSMRHCNSASRGIRPGSPSGVWTLAIKHGQDGKDAPQR